MQTKVIENDAGTSYYSVCSPFKMFSRSSLIGRLHDQGEMLPVIRKIFLACSLAQQETLYPFAKPGIDSLYSAFFFFLLMFTRNHFKVVRKLLYYRSSWFVSCPPRLSGQCLLLHFSDHHAISCHSWWMSRACLTDVTCCCSVVWFTVIIKIRVQFGILLKK